MNLLFSYLFFLLKTLTLVGAILFTVISLLVLSKNKNKVTNGIKIMHINKRYKSLTQQIQQEILSKSQLKLETKKQKQLTEQLKNKDRKRIFYLEFCGDLHASEVKSLREKITTVLAVATPEDEVLVNVESAGGVVHGYGLCASQLARLREKNIPLTVVIDKVAASGGYMMASVADYIIAAPFAIIGSIGVVAQLPNFHRFLKEHHIDFEQITAGEYKRTLTLFGENTNKAKHKVQTEIDHTHQLFKQFILQYRPQLDIDQVATGEYWFGSDALNLRLIDKIDTSDDYLQQASHTADIYEIQHHTKRTLLQKLTRSTSKIMSEAKLLKL